MRQMKAAWADEAEIDAAGCRHRTMRMEAAWPMRSTRDARVLYQCAGTFGDAQQRQVAVQVVASSRSNVPKLRISSVRYATREESDVLAV